MRDTPRTDFEEQSWDREYDRSREAGWPSIVQVVDADFARELERENSRLREGISRICSSIGNGSAASPDASLEFLCVCVADEVLQYCDRLRGENVRLREALERIESLSRRSGWSLYAQSVESRAIAREALKGGAK